MLTSGRMKMSSLC